MYVLLAIVGLVATASAKDLTVGVDGGSLKYEQNITASPTIWRQEKKVTFNVSDSEVITKVAVVDRREDKNGEAAILEGGEGHKNVTIELKSPAVFRGFDFEIQVYAKQEGDAQSPVNNDQQNVQDPLLQDTQVNDKQVPNKEDHDVITGSQVTTSSTTPLPNDQDKVQHPIVIGQEDNQKVRPNHYIKGQETEQKTVTPALGKHSSTSTTTIESTKTENESDGAQDKQCKDCNPMINDKDWQETIDDIFKNKPTVKPTKPEGEKTKPVTESSTLKTIEGQQTEKPVHIQEANGQQAKNQANVPLPYINH